MRSQTAHPTTPMKRDTETQQPNCWLGVVSLLSLLCWLSLLRLLCPPVSHLSEFLTGVWDAAMKKPMPEKASEYYVGSMRKLIALCHELQVAAKDGTFSLTCRDAGALLGIPFQLANKWLHKLEKDGVILRVSTGVYNPHGKGKGNEYRWTG